LCVLIAKEGSERERREDRAPSRDEARHAKDERVLRCAVCAHTITTERARIEVSGAHVHTFVNPAGQEFTIGCFGEAPGCVGVGEVSAFWSWFSGHSWQAAACGRCGAHLGWLFRSAHRSFAGLILAALR
jgi:hypothetical protein